MTNFAADPRKNYEAVRLAVWSIRDALHAASHIAGRASDCFDGTDLCPAFDAVRSAISRLCDESPEMQRVTSAMHEARGKL